MNPLILKSLDKLSKDYIIKLIQAQNKAEKLGITIFFTYCDDLEYAAVMADPGKFAHTHKGPDGSAEPTVYINTMCGRPLFHTMRNKMNNFVSIDTFLKFN